MTDSNLETPKVPNQDSPRKDWPTVSTRIPPKDLEDLDDLARKRRVKRAELIYEALRQFLSASGVGT